MMEGLRETCKYFFLHNVTNYGSDNYVFNGKDKITKTINKVENKFIQKAKSFWFLSRIER